MWNKPWVWLEVGMLGKGKTPDVSTDDGTAMPSPREEKKKRAKLASVSNNLTYSFVYSGSKAMMRNKPWVWLEVGMLGQAAAWEQCL